MNYPKNRYTGEKPWMDKEWLYNEYIVKQRSTKNIAEEYGCKRNTIQCWLAKHKIKREGVVPKEIVAKHPYQDKNYLYKQHIILRKTLQEIANENGVDYDTIRYFMLRHGIEYWTPQPRHKYSKEEEATICDLYINQKISANELSKRYQTDHNTILRIVERNGYPTRSMQEAQLLTSNDNIDDLFYDNQELSRLHWQENKSCKEIGAMIGVDGGTIRRQMQKMGLKTRNVSESKKGQMVGELHPNWKGGITKLTALLREYFGVNIAPKVSRRDNYTCQMCGDTHTILNVHHIVPFKTIVDQIILEHPEYNVVDNKQELYEIITHDERFLDEDNLITYCKKCHQKLHSLQRQLATKPQNEEGSETIESAGHAVNE